jgi:hypothetical protein
VVSQAGQARRESKGLNSYSASVYQKGKRIRSMVVETLTLPSQLQLGKREAE